MTTHLTSDILLKAYCCGVFPMAEDAGDPNLFWVDPQRRGVLPLDACRFPRKLLKKVRQEPAPKLKAQVEAVRMKLRGALAGSVMPDRRRPRPCAMKHLMEEKV